MKKIPFILKTSIVLASVASIASADSIMKPFNDQGYGEISGRIRSVTMARDYDGKGNASNSTIGGIIGYTTPEFAGIDAGVAYNYAAEIFDNNHTAMLWNDEIDILNEAWARFNFGAAGADKTTLIGGYKINNGEVFRADDIRQKSRSLLAVLAESKDIDNLRITGGHAFKASDVLQGETNGKHRWDFRDFGDIFSTHDYSHPTKNAYDDTDGVSWIETMFTGVDNLEVALFDAYAWDVVNMLGTRIQYNVTSETAILAYGRYETDTGDMSSYEGTAFGASVVQKVASVRLEAGYFGVYSDGLKFNQFTTGFNHALGSSLMVFAGQWNPGSDSYYFKATTKIEATGTVLYTLFNYNDNDNDAYEWDLIAKQPVVDNLMAVVKFGMGRKVQGDLSGTDIRFFLDYNF